MVSWVAVPRRRPRPRPRAWLAGTGCDAWILHTAVEDPLTAAAAWNGDLAGDEVRYGQAIDRWLEYFRGEAIEAIAYGAIVLRRRAGGRTGSAIGSCRTSRGRTLPPTSSDCSRDPTCRTASPTTRRWRRRGSGWRRGP